MEITNTDWIIIGALFALKSAVDFIKIWKRQPADNTDSTENNL